MSTHAELSPSSAERWVTCPGSVALSRGLTDTSSAAANEGTGAHDLAARALVSGLPADSYKRLAMEGGSVVDDDMARHVQGYIDRVHAFRDAVDGELFVEQRLPIDHITGEKDASGTSDVVIVGETELIVIDLKYGMGVTVIADNNWQLMTYALGALRKFALCSDFETVRLVIDQPRLGAVSEWVITVPELEAFGAKLSTAAEATRQPDAPLVPSSKGCRWCRAKATCPALANEVLDMFEGGFTEASAPIQPTDAAERLAYVLDRADMIEAWVKAIRGAVDTKLRAGELVPGYKLVQGKRGNRKWSSDENAIELLKAMRLKHDVMYSYSVISPTTAEKLFKAGTIGKRQWPKVLDIITQTEGGASVAPESDKRPALVMDVTADFDVIVPAEPDFM